MSGILRLIKEKVDLGVVAGVVITIGVASFWRYLSGRRRQIEKVGILDLIGNTPLVYLPKLSKSANCHIYLKMQYLNPFGSSKDRAVKQFLTAKKQQFREVVEASSGSTAISLVQMSHILGKKTTLFLPNDLAQDKYLLLQTLKAKIVKVPPVSIVDSNHFFNLAMKYAKEEEAYFTNQFQNVENAKVHFQTTGPQIYRQTRGLVDCFICGGGTGGTLAGVSRYLKSRNQKIEVVLADPEGSGLFNKVKYDVLFTGQEKEGHRLKNPFDTVVEGVGLNRATANFEKAKIDDAFKVTDRQILHMAYYLLQNEGLFVGGSTAMNLVAAVKQGRRKEGSNIVTVAHDSGIRYLKKLYSGEYLRGKNIEFEKRESYEWDDISFVE